MNSPQFWTIPPSELSPSQLAAKTQALQERLVSICDQFDDVRFATSLAAEDMVITCLLYTSDAADE